MEQESSQSKYKTISDTSKTWLRRNMSLSIFHHLPKESRKLRIG